MSKLKSKNLLITALVLLLIFALVWMIIGIQVSQETPTINSRSTPVVQPSKSINKEAGDTQATNIPKVTVEKSPDRKLTEKNQVISGGYLILNGNEFNQLFDHTELDNLIWPNQPPSITDDETLDQQIRQIATNRGYKQRPMPTNLDQLLVVENNHYLQPAAAQAYKDLRAAAATEGLTIWLVSAYRSYDQQRSLFLREVSDPSSEAAVFERLKLVAIPGYSKHHTGYAIDIAEGNLIFADFANSASYSWLSANNYENAKKYGWIPSYPPDAQNQGPDPEPWEFTYVGRQHLIDSSQEP